MIEKIDHIGIVVKDMERGLEVYTKGLGLTIAKEEYSEEFQVKVAFLPVGEVMVELLQPTGPGIVQDFLDEHGEGLHHICYKVPDIISAMKEVGEHIPFRDKEPKPGGAGSKVAFLDPKYIFNTETELVQRDHAI